MTARSQPEADEQPVWYQRGWDEGYAAARAALAAGLDAERLASAMDDSYGNDNVTFIDDSEFWRSFAEKVAARLAKEPIDQ